ncbi:MAG: acyltransferase [Arenimonas sp.]
MNPALHGLRGFAALMVLLFHWSTFFPAVNTWLAGIKFGPSPWMNLSLPLAVGWQGVPLFFVLSAYLLTSQWINRPLTKSTLATFWKRRFLRIYPAVWFQLACLLVFSSLIFSTAKPLHGVELINNIVLWIHLPPTMTEPLNGVWWTLPIELMFYLALPLLVYLQRSWSLLLVVLICLVSSLLWRIGVIWYFHGIALPEKIYIIDAIPGSLFTFSVGFFLAFIPTGISKSNFFSLLLFVCLFYFSLEYLQWEFETSYWQGSWIMVVWGPLFACVVGAAVYLTLNSPFRLGLFTNRLLIWCGNLSFGIYLWHYPVLNALQTYWSASLDGRFGSLIALGAGLIITLCFAATSYYLIERPLMGWGKQS